MVIDKTHAVRSRSTCSSLVSVHGQVQPTSHARISIQRPAFANRSAVLPRERGWRVEVMDEYHSIAKKRGSDTCQLPQQCWFTQTQRCLRRERIAAKRLIRVPPFLREDESSVPGRRGSGVQDIARRRARTRSRKPERQCIEHSTTSA